MKKIISFFILLSIFTVSHAQKKKLELGFMGGLNVSNFYIKPVDFKKANLKSFNVGVELAYVLSNNLSIRSNLSYEVKGEETNIYPIDFPGNLNEGHTNINLGYATINLLTRGSFGNKIRFFIEGGPYASYLVKAQAIDKFESFNVNGVTVIPGKEDIKYGYKSTNIGITAGIGVIYPINDKTGLTLSARRSLGLTSISKYSDMKTNSTAIQLGASFKL